MKENQSEYIKCGEYGCYQHVAGGKGDCLKHIKVVDRGEECHLKIKRLDAEAQRQEYEKSKLEEKLEHAQIQPKCKPEPLTLEHIQALEEDLAHGIHQSEL